MSKQEFIDRLRAALSGRVSAGLVEENVAYYEEYINTQIRLGKLEESVLASLGDPRLIAKSIITANDGNVVNNVNAEYNEDYNSGYYTEKSGKKSLRINGLPGWLIALIVIVVIILILSAVFSIISSLLPILLPILVVYFFIKLFRDWLK